jgi:hypothetical protein
MLVSKRYTNLLILCCCAIVISCNSVTTEEDQAKPYFDIDSFIKDQITYLSKNNFSIEKTIVKEGIVESKKSKSPDWKKELDPFSSSDINKPNWKLSYTIDSIYVDDTLMINFNCKDSNLVVKYILVKLVNQKVFFLQIKNHKLNSYFNSSQMLELIPDSGYSIFGHQGVLLGDTTSYSIKARFIKNN